MYVRFNHLNALAFKYFGTYGGAKETVKGFQVLTFTLSCVFFMLNNKYDPLFSPKLSFFQFHVVKTKKAFSKSSVQSETL